MTGRPTLAVFMLACCLVTSPIAAPLADIDRTPLEDEVVDVRMDRKVPSKLSARTLVPLEEADAASNAGRGDSRNDSELAAEDGGGGSMLIGGLLETVLALPGSVATGLEGLLSGVVGGLLGGTKVVH